MEDKLILKQYNLILIRYAEIWLKSQKVKIRMLKYLMNNIKNVLKRKAIPFNKYQMSKDSARVFFFFNNKDINNAINVLINAFGVHSISPAIRTSNKLKRHCFRAFGSPRRPFLKPILSIFSSLQPAKPYFSMADIS